MDFGRELHKIVSLSSSISRWVSVASLACEAFVHTMPYHLAIGLAIQRININIVVQ